MLPADAREIRTVKILVDADACPVVIREILFRAALKRQVMVTLFANQALRVPPSPWISMYQVPQGADVADDEIAARVIVGDLVITADIPLASEVLAKGAHVLTPRGERYTEANIKQRLQMRDFMETMRASGEHTGGPPPLNHSDRKAFADQLDRLLTRLLQSTQ
jgi:uncharacterized protein YaiI (UPF0178 family)